MNAAGMTYKKATQALNFLARKKDGKINKMKAIKLIYLADRLHLRKYGRPIVGDTYWAMKLGPVGSLIKNVAELSTISDEALVYAKRYIKPADEKKQVVTSIRPEEMGVFSKTDIECLESVYEKYSDKDQFELAEITHEFPEWTKHKEELVKGKKRVRMDYRDFFVGSHGEKGLFSQDRTDLEMAKGSFLDQKEVSEFFSK